jgi:hypothetical protein
MIVNTAPKGRPHCDFEPTPSAIASPFFGHFCLVCAATYKYAYNPFSAQPRPDHNEHQGHIPEMLCVASPFCLAFLKRHDWPISPLRSLFTYCRLMLIWGACRGICSD